MEVCNMAYMVDIITYGFKCVKKKMPQCGIFLKYDLWSAIKFLLSMAFGGDKYPLITSPILAECKPIINFQIFIRIALCFFQKIGI